MCLVSFNTAANLSNSLSEGRTTGLVKKVCVAVGTSSKSAPATSPGKPNTLTPFSLIAVCIARCIMVVNCLGVLATYTYLLQSWNKRKGLVSWNQCVPNFCVAQVLAMAITGLPARLAS